MLVSIQFICIAISLIVSAIMFVGGSRSAGWTRFHNGILFDAMFAFVLFTFLLTIVVSVLLRPY